MAEPFLTTRDVAHQLRVTQQAVTAWCREGTLPASRAGRLWRIEPIELAKFIRKGVPKVAEHQMV